MPNTRLFRHRLKDDQAKASRQILIGGNDDVASVFEALIFADYHQFYLTSVGNEPDYADDITDATMTERIIARDDVLVIFAARNMDVPVAVELHDSEPALNLSEADHIVDAGLNSSGTLLIAGCTDYLPDAAQLDAPTGDLKARVLFSGLDTLSEDGLEGEDRYRVQLWPGKADGVRVLKRWEEG